MWQLLTGIIEIQNRLHRSDGLGGEWLVRSHPRLLFLHFDTYRTDISSHMIDQNGSFDEWLMNALMR